MINDNSIVITWVARYKAFGVCMVEHNLAIVELIVPDYLQGLIYKLSNCVQKW
jgi:hypothetical protein